jgi:hypothetical protein
LVFVSFSPPIFFLNHIPRSLASSFSSAFVRLKNKYHFPAKISGTIVIFQNNLEKLELITLLMAGNSARLDVMF